MKKNSYLDGENIKPKTAAEARKLIGKKIKYLRGFDISHTRGIYWPRYEVVKEVKERNIHMDDDTWIHFSEIHEIELISD